MTAKGQPTDTRERNVAQRLAREELATADPGVLAQRAGVLYTAVDAESGWFTISFACHSYRLRYPQGVVEADEGMPRANYALSLIMLHYLLHADGTPPADRWVAFRELPDGLVYDSALRGRAEPPLLAAFGRQPQRLRAAAEALGGQPLSFGDVSYAVQALPRLPMGVVLHLADDEFPPAARLLYDASAGHYLPTEDLAVLGGLLVGALLKAAPP